MDWRWAATLSCSLAASCLASRDAGTPTDACGAPIFMAPQSGCVTVDVPTTHTDSCTIGAQPIHGPSFVADGPPGRMFTVQILSPATYRGGCAFAALGCGVCSDFADERHWGTAYPGGNAVRYILDAAREQSHFIAKICGYPGRRP